MEETLTFKGLVKTIKKRLWLIMLITLTFGLLSAVVSYFILTPTYQLKAQLLVNQTSSEQQLYETNEVQTNIQLINTYNVVIKSPAILEEVQQNLNLDRTIEDLDSQIQVTSAKDTQVVEIVVEDTEPHVAAKIANTTAEVFQEKITGLMNVDNVNILSPAVVKENIQPVKPSPLTNITLAIVLGLMIGTAVVFILDYLDNTIKTEDDIADSLGLPVIGVIASMNDLPDTAVKSTNATRSQKVRGETIGS